MVNRRFATLTILAGALLGAAGSKGRTGATRSVAGDTIPVATREFLTRHSTLINGFAQLMQRAVGTVTTHTDRANLLLYLRAEVLPHARAEERVLYPALENVLGTKGYATATMVFDHKAIARLVDDLGALAGSPNPEAFRRKAYALDALLETHFAKEEEFILPLLRQHMNAADVQALFERMEALPSFED